MIKLPHTTMVGFRGAVKPHDNEAEPFHVGNAPVWQRKRSLHRQVPNSLFMDPLAKRRILVVHAGYQLIETLVLQLFEEAASVVQQQTDAIDGHVVDSPLPPARCRR